MLATTSGDGSVKLWDFTRSCCSLTLSEHRQPGNECSHTSLCMERAMLCVQCGSVIGTGVDSFWHLEAWITAPSCGTYPEECVCTHCEDTLTQSTLFTSSLSPTPSCLPQPIKPSLTGTSELYASNLPNALNYHNL